MELDITENSDFRLKKVFNPVVFETDEGERMSICMRDGGFELNIENPFLKKTAHFLVKDGQITRNLDVTV